MIVLSGASASGKTEAAKMLMSKYGITRAITTTTRSRRYQEVDGKDYFFVTKETFEQMIADGAFVEYTIYNGNYYGSSKSQIADNRSVVIDLEGLKSYTQFNDERIVTFYLYASEDLCYKRMLERGDTLDDACRRLANDRKLFAKHRIPKVDYIIDSEKKSIEEVADEVYRLYNEHLKR